MRAKTSAAVDNLAAAHPKVCDEVVDDAEIFLWLQLSVLQDFSTAAVTFGTYKVPAGCSRRDNKAIFPGFDGAVTARAAVLHRHLKTAWHLASFRRLQSIANHFETGKAKKRLVKVRTRT